MGAYEIQLAAETGGRLPDFLLLGAMKSGTTTLYRQLRDHPDLFLSRPKEPQYFSRESQRRRGIDWYTSLFAHARDDQRCGEASTCYTRYPHFGDVAGRIADQLPNVRMVYVMRHPAERCYSHYRHVMQERISSGNEAAVVSLEEALSSLPEIVDASLYAVQISQFFAHFPREQFHFLTLDELRADPEPTMSTLLEFLGARPEVRSESREVYANQFGDDFAHREMHKLVGRLRGSTPLTGLVPRPVRAWVRRRLTDPRITRHVFRGSIDRVRSRISEFTPETRRELIARFIAPNLELGELLKRPLPNWDA